MYLHLNYYLKLIFKEKIRKLEYSFTAFILIVLLSIPNK